MIIKAIVTVLLSVSLLSDPFSTTEFREPQVLKLMGTSWEYYEDTNTDVYIFRDASMFYNC